MKYIIVLEGCDDETDFEMELNQEEADLLKRVSEISNETSHYACMPVMSITPKE